QNLQSADDGDKTNSSPGRARYKPLKPLRAGMPGVPVTCGDYRVLTTIAHGLRVHRAPGIPHALIFLGERFLHASGASRRESAQLRRDPPPVIVREGGRSSIPRRL
ncbi:hypothetical protein, partial [Bradyrhizobium sp. URHD0069]|uniref:hypothetical protein n=1 Tax=Bradyrhizobium sp. URHD0069 TaxID=1380355 RepID=UPI001AEBC951